MAPTTQDRLALLEESLQTTVERQTTVQSENDTLRERIATLTALPIERDATPQSTALSTTTGRTIEPKVAQPEYFTGQRNKLSTFITQVTMVIQLQSTRYPTELSKILYTGSFLRDTAFLWFQPYVLVTPPPTFFTSFNTFTDELKKIFGDPDEVGTAERQLYGLRQRGSAATYMADFTRFAVLVKWNDDAKSAQFYRGLKDAIKDELGRTGKPASLHDLQEAAIRIDTRLFERHIEKGDGRPLANLAFANRTYNRPFTSTRTTTESTYNRPQSNYPGRPSESLRATFQPRDKVTQRGRLTPAEYQRRKDENLCLYCGEKGHLVTACPKAPPARRSFRPNGSSSPKE